METKILIGIIIGLILLLLGLFCRIFGFRTVGVEEGSRAACYQSSMGNVDKGSWFATLAMKGVFVKMIKFESLFLLS